MATAWWTFDRFLAGELPLEELVEWIAGTPALADLLAPEELGQLRGIDPAARRFDASEKVVDSPVRTLATYVVENGRPGAQRE